MGNSFNIHCDEGLLCKELSKSRSKLNEIVVKRQLPQKIRKAKLYIRENSLQNVHLAKAIHKIEEAITNENDSTEPDIYSQQRVISIQRSFRNYLERKNALSQMLVWVYTNSKIPSSCFVRTNITSIGTQSNINKSPLVERVERKCSFFNTKQKSKRTTSCDYSIANNDSNNAWPTIEDQKVAIVKPISFRNLYYIVKNLVKHGFNLELDLSARLGVIMLNETSKIVGIIKKNKLNGLAIANYLDFNYKGKKM